MCIRDSYASNGIHTSKYTMLNFIPKNMIEQFSKLANVYFLIIGAMQTIKEISTSGGKPIILLPLTIILTISALKDLFEDLKRHKACLLYTSPSPRDGLLSRMPSSA
eukprot:TRINITY_DN18440_c0_g1_i1.p3 TRINITY_DN18440_c0_g1~~TRINITY_DN18440_c0_g1_i1.p3  ORF type:complete len:121 (-),score=44.90 TRINITY_DN18440_c0_g1_i1:7-327(-)